MARRLQERLTRARSTGRQATGVPRKMRTRSRCLQDPPRAPVLRTSRFSANRLHPLSNPRRHLHTRAVPAEQGRNTASALVEGNLQLCVEVARWCKAAAHCAGYGAPRAASRLGGVTGAGHLLQHGSDPRVYEPRVCSAPCPAGYSRRPSTFDRCLSRVNRRWNKRGISCRNQ